MSAVGSNAPAMSDYRLLAPVYDPLARLVFGRTLQEAKHRFYDAVRPGDAVLVLGGGTGDGIGILATLPGVGIDFIEPCGAMIRKATGSLPAPLREKVRFIRGDHTVLPAGPSYDVIVTHFLIDGLGNGEAKEAMNRIARTLRGGGRWLMADFFDSGRPRHRLLTRTMYLFFRALAGIRARQLPDYDRLFQSTGLVLDKEHQFLEGYVRSRVYVRPEGS